MSVDPAKGISENLKTYHEAFKEEIAALGKLDSEEKISKCREKLSLLLPSACEELSHIVRTGTKDDTVRLNGIKLVFEYTMGKPAQIDRKDDELGEILSKLIRQPSAEITHNS